MAANAEIPNPVTEDYVLAENETVDGTLTVNSGVTVYLNGKTLTVSGLAGSGTISTSDTPEGYEQLEYAEATSDGRQYIDTGVKAISEAKIVADVMYTGTTGSGTYKPLISSATGSNGNTKTSKTYGVWIWTDDSVSKWVMFFSGSQINSSASVVQNEQCTIEASWKSNSRTLYYNGTSKIGGSTSSISPSTVNETMYLPARNLGGNVNERGEFKIYSFKIYNPQSTLVRDFIPARRLSDGAVGFYDAAGKTFFESLSGTSFVASEKTFGEGCGELHLDVAEGATLQNSTVNIAKAVKVVKEGTGTYIASKENYYKGGTVIAAGKARATVTGGSYGFGAWGTEVFVEDGGQVIMNGNQSALNGYDLTIAGSGPDGNGALYGNVSKDYDARNFESLSLSADATVKTIARDALNLRNNYATEFPLNLYGHTLTVTGNSRFIVWNVNALDEGRIVADISPGNNAKVNCFYSLGVFNAPLVDFVVPAGKAVGGEAPFVISNMTFGGVWQEATSACTLKVLGRYAPQPSATRLPIVTLGDTEHLSPVLDLSALSGTYDATSRALCFQNGSSVTVETGAREISIGDRLVSFAAGGVPDPSVGFTLCTNGVAVADRSLVVKDGDDGRGIYVKNALEPAFARWVGGEWKFFMENGDEYEGEWTGGVTDTIEVRFSTEAEYEAICATNFTPSAFVMTGFTGAGNVTSDLTRVSFLFEEGMSVDVNGGRVKLPASMTGGSKAFTVTNSAEQEGTLEVEVAGGATVNNTAMSIEGNIKLVKTGGGVFVSKVSQTYTGGTDVEAGTLRPADSPADNNYTYSGDNFTAFGTGAVNVLPGAVFDVRGNYAYTNVILKGGTIANTLRTMSQTAKPGLFISSLADADESYFNMRQAGQGKYDMAYGKAGLATDLAGKTLTITEYGSLTVRSAFTNGTLKVLEENGWFILNSAFDMSSTTFDNSCALNVGGVVEIGEYIHSKDTQYMRGTGSFNIHRRFCPVASSYFYRSKMLDGSVLDLSQRDTVFNTRCKTDENKNCDLTFADNATIKIKLGERAATNGLKIVGWTTEPSNLAGLNFVCGDEGRSYAIIKKNDGLYIYTGLAISVR